MPKLSRIDQLDHAIQAMLAGSTTPRVGEDLAPLLEIAGELRELPRDSFKARLKSELERKATMATATETLAAIRQTVTPRLRIKNCAAAIEFYKKAFGAKEIMRFAGPGGGDIGHAELEIGNSVIMVSESAPNYGSPGPEFYGGSPIGLQLYVEDVDAFVGKAVSAGARLVQPVSDQFYGDRSGSVADPYGYTWGVATHKISMSLEEMHQRFQEMEKEQAAGRTAASPIPEGYHSVTQYLVAQDAAGLIDFVKQVFGGEERFRGVGGAGGIHCEIRVGDSMMMIGGGGPGLSWKGEAVPAALHVYVQDTDAAYHRALEAGAVSDYAPSDMEYGERSAGVRDPAGNRWYIATAKGENHIPAGMQTVNPYLHPLRAEPVIGFLKRAFGGEELARYATPDGVIHHATVKVGDSVVEMGEANGPYQPMPAMFYLYVPDVDATYRRALQAGASSMSEPVTQSYGDRSAGVKDVFGNQWYIATRVQDGGGAG